MTCQIEEMSESCIAYMRRVGPYGADNYVLMKKFKEWANVNGLFTASAVILGISQDNPAVTPPENCRYDVGVIVSEQFTTADTDVNVAELSGGKYAVFTIAHTAEAIQKAWAKSLFNYRPKAGSPTFPVPSSNGTFLP